MNRLVITLFSAGWVVPFWAAAAAYLEFLQAGVWPRLLHEAPLNSFPYIDFCQRMLAIGSVWLTCALFYWAWRASKVKGKK